MALKRWFGRGDDSGTVDPEDMSTEDLIVLERYGEAEKRLLAKIKKKPSSLRDRLKLAEVYEASAQHDKAVHEYVALSDLYSADGFHDKGKAILSRAVRLRPLDESLKRRLEIAHRAKRMEHSRVLATESVMAGSGNTESAVALQQLWGNLATSTLVRRLGNDQLQRLFSVMRMVKGAPGKIVAQRGSRDARLFVILQGTVEAIYGRDRGSVASLRSFSPGDVIGEGALLEHLPWPATYRITEPATLFYLEREGLEKALVGNPDPMAFLTALREQGNDRVMAEMIGKLESH